MLVDEIKKRVVQAMKDNDTVAKDILRLALGEIQTSEARSGRPATEEEAVGALRKLVKSNEETLSMSTDDAQKATLLREIALLGAFLPATMTTEAILAALAPVKDAIVAAKSEGQATGVAMKHLKSTGATVSGNDVGVAIKQLRGATAPAT